MPNSIQKSLLTFVNQYLPLIIRQEMEKQQINEWMKKSLMQYRAQHEYQTQETQQQLLNKILENVADPSNFSGRAMPEFGGVSALNRMGALPPGITLPPGLGQNVEGANDAITRLVMAAQAGNALPQPDIDTVSGTFGADEIQKLLDITTKVSEGGKTRVTTERGQDVTTAGQGVQQGNIDLGWAKLRAETSGKKTDKELNAAIEDREKERRKVRADIAASGKGGDLDNPSDMNNINYNEITRSLRALREQKYGDEPAKYMSWIDTLIDKGYDKSDLDKLPELKAICQKSGIDIATLKKYWK